MTRAITARCLCGGIAYEISGPVPAAYHCHCENCRRATASPFTTWFTVPKQNLRFTKGEPKRFQSSPGVTRSFCADCGSPVSYERETTPETIDLYAASLDDASLIHVGQHDFWSERVPWLTMTDDLPKQG